MTEPTLAEVDWPERFRRKEGENTPTAPCPRPRVTDISKAMDNVPTAKDALIKLPAARLVAAPSLPPFAFFFFFFFLFFLMLMPSSTASAAMAAGPAPEESEDDNDWLARWPLVDKDAFRNSTMRSLLLSNVFISFFMDVLSLLNDLTSSSVDFIGCWTLTSSLLVGRSILPIRPSLNWSCCACYSMVGRLLYLFPVPALATQIF
mmetsp:Transcript_36253/g.77308  ORF Transcript_36253/g.77308 Transcript_36253/m.77308 type:complete len:205 (+) Transcript_36253:1642-2256(+)